MFATQRGFGTHTPSRRLARASRNVNGRRVSLPIDGEIAAPDIAIAAGSVKSVVRLRGRSRISGVYLATNRLATWRAKASFFALELLRFGVSKRSSSVFVSTAPTSGPPTA